MNTVVVEPRSHRDRLETDAQRLKETQIVVEPRSHLDRIRTDAQRLMETQMVVEPCSYPVVELRSHDGTDVGSPRIRVQECWTVGQSDDLEQMGSRLMARSPERRSFVDAGRGVSQGTKGRHIGIWRARTLHGQKQLMARYVKEIAEQVKEGEASVKETVEQVKVGEAPNDCVMLLDQVSRPGVTTGGSLGVVLG